MRTVDILLSAPQAAAMTAMDRYVDAEGAIRSGKSTIAAEKVASWVVQYPGIHVLACRWKDTDLDAQVKPLWRKVAQEFGLTLRWNATEQCDEVVGYGSRVYLRGLKAGEETSRYSKFRGLTLAFIWVDQAEEVPEDVALELKGRLSQPGFPHQLLFTPNPPGLNHWLAREFPDDNSRPNYRYIRFALDDNAHNLGADTVQALKDAYPEGTAMRRRLVDGKRGLASVGDPVYRGYFHRALHEQMVSMNPHLPLLEGWDFGHRHPAVVWEQRVMGRTIVLGGMMGESMFLQDFAPIALQLRTEWFGQPYEVRRTGDPAGEAHSSQGVKQRAVDVLFELDRVPCVTLPNANHIERRNYAIQQTARAMRSRTADGEAFVVSPRFALVSAHAGVKELPILADGFEAGYVWDEKAIAGSLSPNTRRPKKDGFYDHSMNCHEYVELMYGESLPNMQDERRLEQRALRESQRDVDLADRPSRSRRFGGRAGY